jgi:hypothetical protein
MNPPFLKNRFREETFKSKKESKRTRGIQENENEMSGNSHHS